jgi:hypothetical protein
LVNDERAKGARRRREHVQAVFNDLPLGPKERIPATIEKLFVENLPIANAELPSIRPVLDQAAVRLGFAPQPLSRRSDVSVSRKTPRHDASSTMKGVLVAVLRSDKFEDKRLEAADRAFLRRWADNCADDPIWEEIISFGLLPLPPCSWRVCSRTGLLPNVADSAEAAGSAAGPRLGEEVSVARRLAAGSVVARLVWAASARWEGASADRRSAVASVAAVLPQRALGASAAELFVAPLSSDDRPWPGDRLSSADLSSIAHSPAVGSRSFHVGVS